LEIYGFEQWFQQSGEQGRLLSVRDLFSWVSFMNITWTDLGPNNAFVHGALLVLLDGIGLGELAGINFSILVFWPEL
jgi:midasin